MDGPDVQSRFLESNSHHSNQSKDLRLGGADQLDLKEPKKQLRMAEYTLASGFHLVQ